VDVIEHHSDRKPVFPAEWQDQFGLPYNEHRQSMQINIFDGYAVFAVKENTDAEKPVELPADAPQALVSVGGETV